MTYTASLDTTAKTLTIIISVLFPVVLISQQLFLLSQGSYLISSVITVFIVLIFLLAFGYRPLRYSFTPDELIIHRPLRNVAIHREDIIEVRVLSAKALGTVIRTFGVGGFFGYFGHFSSSTLGTITMYATRRDRLVLLRTKTGQKIIVSPDEPQNFKDAFAL